MAALALSAPAAHAVSWTEVPSNTTEDITAVEYRGAAGFWIATANGKILKRSGETFGLKTASAGTVFTDIEFNAAGTVGFAVGTNGKLMRSQDGGDSWVNVMLPDGGDQTSDNQCGGVDEAPGDLDSVTFQSPTRAWVTGGGTQIWRTTAGATEANVGSTTGGWEYANDAGADCKIEQDVDDIFPVAGSDSLYFVAKSFGGMWFTSNGLTGAASKKAASAGNGFQETRRLAGDPTNPNRQWSVAPNGSGGSYVARTTTGWSSEDGFSIATPDTDFDKMYDIDYEGGTVLTAGDAGSIATSVDGTNFYIEPAGGALATQAWRSVSVASATDAAIGGTGGKLIVSTTANQVRDIVKPTGTISGPSSGTTGSPLTFTATIADEAGGSGINAAASSWTTPGLPNQSGPSATFTFPQPGVYTITLTFADNAGNTNTATASVDVTQGTGNLPTPVLPGSTKPPLVGGAAKKKGKYVVFKVKGKLGLPAGVTAAQGCNGTMSISVYKRKKRLAAKRTRVKSSCRYKKTIKVKRKKVGKAKKLKLKVAFKGNSFLAPLSSTYKAKVK